MTRLERVAVIGVGLIGGSFALALRKAGACASVIGAGRNAENLRIARERGVIDAIANDAAEAVRGADLVLVSVPVGQMQAVFEAIRPALGGKAVVTDAGSTKRDVIEAARRGLEERFARFVPAHPIAGGERSGAGAAESALFEGKRVVVTPLRETAADALAVAEGAWQACRARISRMAPDEHDAVFAAVSHLPHVLAFALVHDVARHANAAQLFGYAAGGFRDFTRIASSHPEMWRDICVANRDVLLAEFDRYLRELGELRSMLERGDGEALERVFTEARAARNRWLSGDFSL